MIDTHCHILWGVDDASQTESETLDMLRLASSDGVKVIVATSHVKYPLYPNTLSTLQKALDQLNEAKEKNNIAIEVVLGAENFVNHKTIHLLKSDDFITYNNAGKYMLMEFAWTKNSFDDPTRYIQMVINKGITPVIAHPERYEWVHDNYDILYSWREMGALMQVNRTSVFGFDKIAKANEVALKMLEDDLIDVIGSDAHRPYAPRYPKLSDIYNFVAKEYGEERAERYFVETPKTLIEK